MPHHELDCDGFTLGLQLFNSAQFFAAHEILEDVWRAAPPAERKFLQGLIQVAVALHHYGNGNLAGASSVLRRAARNLAAYPDGFYGVALPPLLRSLEDWQLAIDIDIDIDNDKGGSAPPLPKINLHSSVVSPASSRDH
jgi:predicted metal-dependent hydrolase